eukprot:scaffold3823_cov195-Amphora_coffeaeformis.AAC.36
MLGKNERQDNAGVDKTTRACGVDDWILYMGRRYHGNKRRRFRKIPSFPQHPARVYSKEVDATNGGTIDLEYGFHQHMMWDEQQKAVSPSEGCSYTHFERYGRHGDKQSTACMNPVGGDTILSRLPKNITFA